MKFSGRTGKPTTSKGLGDATTLEERLYHLGNEGGAECIDPFCQVMGGSVRSHEIATRDSLMFISLVAQGTMSLVKDVESGTCYCKNEKMLVKFYSIVGSSFRAIVVHDPGWFGSEGVKILTRKRGNLNTPPPCTSYSKLSQKMKILKQNIPPPHFIC